MIIEAEVFGIACEIRGEITGSYKKNAVDLFSVSISGQNVTEYLTSRFLDACEEALLESFFTDSVEVYGKDLD